MDLDNLEFVNNTGTYSFFEEEHKLPFYDILTMGQFKLNFLKVNALEACRDEIA